MSQPYDSLDEAVYSAAVAARAMHQDVYEATALVYEKDGKFFFTDPQNSGTQKGKRFEARLQFPKGAKPRYLVHNHPAGDDSDRFSPEDVKMSGELGIPSAIVFGKEPTIRTYTPGKSRLERISGRNISGKFSYGDPLNWPPVEAEPEVIRTSGTHNTLLP